MPGTVILGPRLGLVIYIWLGNEEAVHFGLGMQTSFPICDKSLIILVLYSCLFPW